jgi:DNA polymerase-3 subunit epsilon
VISQMQTAAHRTRLWPIAAAAIILLALITALVTTPYGLVLLLLGLPAVLWLRQRDIARRSVVVFYQVDDDPAIRFDHLATTDGFTSRVQRVWHVEAQGNLTNPYQQKVNAGASSLIRRSAASLNLDGPPVLVTNIAVPSLQGKNRSVYFLPDRVLIRQGKNYAEVPYAALHATAYPQRFIEEESPPGDSQIVGSTWRYANVKGGPDRRFKNNRQLPIMLYGRLTLSSQAGLLMVWDFSRPDVAASLAEALTRMT